MILVDFNSKHLISIVLLVITYFYLAETKSINSTKFPISELTSCHESNQTYLLYTTGSCFIKFNKLDHNLQIKRDSLHKINLTDCDTTDDQVFRQFDYFFDNKRLNLIAFNRKQFSLSVGELDLNETIFRIRSVYQLNSSNIQFVVDRRSKLIYLANRGSIEQIDLVSGSRSKLDVECKSPSYLQLNGDRLVWIERESDGRTCFYEWSLDLKKQSNLVCVKQDVQSFQLIQDTVYFVTQSGSLFRFDRTHSATYDAFNSSNEFNNKANKYLNPSPSTIEPKLIYNVAKIKKKFSTHLFRFKLIFNEQSANLYLSDLKHQALLLVNLDRVDALNRPIRPEIVLSDQPSFFDFQFVNFNDCPEDAKTQTKKEIEAAKYVEKSLTKDAIAKDTNDKDTNAKDTNAKDKEIKQEKARISSVDDSLLTEFKQEMQSLNDWNGIESKQLKIENKIQSTNDEYCTVLSCNLIVNLVIFIGLVSLLIVTALAIFLSTKKRYNTLIQADPDDESKCFFKRKINNIQFNITKTIQTV